MLSSTLIRSNYPSLELIFMVPKVFEPLKFDCFSLTCHHLKCHAFEQLFDVKIHAQHYSGLLLFRGRCGIFRNVFIDPDQIIQSKLKPASVSLDMMGKCIQVMDFSRSF